jgi:hypothetical protein
MITAGCDHCRKQQSQARFTIISTTMDNRFFPSLQKISFDSASPWYSKQAVFNKWSPKL